MDLVSPASLHFSMAWGGRGGEESFVQLAIDQELMQEKTVKRNNSQEMAVKPIGIIAKNRKNSKLNKEE